MGNITEQTQWEDHVYLIEKQDKVLGGEEGKINVQAKQLANRTAYLKDQVDGINRDRTDYAPKASPAFSGIPTAPTPNQNTNNTQIATTAFVKTAVAAVNSLAAGKQSPATTLAGYGIGNFKVEAFVGNINTLQTDGVYAVGQASRSQNLPVTGNGCHIQVIGGGDSTWCRQIAYITYSNDVYVRHQMSYQRDEWSPWKKLVLDGLSESQLTLLLQAKADATAFTALHDLFIGVPIPYPLATVPAGCLAMNGQRFDKNRYPKLGQKYPSGVLPDMRGEFIRGWDNGRGVDAGRGLLSAQGEELKSHNHEFGIKSGDSFHQQKVEFTAKTDGIGGNGYSSIYMNKADNGGDKQPYAGAHWVGIKPSGGKETRPRNIAFHYICLAA